MFIFILLFVFTFLLFRGALSIFFVQDDFILISEFSRNNLFLDFVNTIKYPTVTHWRPIHNLYFLILGNLFSTHYLFYHLTAFLLHVGAGLLIFKILERLLQSKTLAFISALIYTVHPAHFVSLYWISGNATTIGFLLMLLSFYLYLTSKWKFALLAFAWSLLASEAMIVGIFLFAGYAIFVEKKTIKDKFLIFLSVLSLVFLIVKFLMTPRSTYGAYGIEFSKNAIVSLKYYLLRILGFGESGGDKISTVLLLIFWFIVIFIFLKNRNKDILVKRLVMFAIVSTLGLFPFIFIPNHLSGHYMNISILGIASAISLSISRISDKSKIFLVALFLIVSALNINAIQKDSWVVKRSNVSRLYIDELAALNMTEGSTVIFNDNYISTSFEAYVALGTGKALDFYFPNKNYKSCFTAFENCEALP